MIKSAQQMAFFAVFLLVPGSLTHADNFSAKKYFNIGKIRVEAVADPDQDFSFAEPPRKNLESTPRPPSSPSLDDGLVVVLDEIINLGKKIWTVVEANRPVVNVRGQVASALPQGLLDWQQLQGWQTPKAQAYRVVYENLYGIDVVDFTYRVSFAYGGNVHGQGLYVTQATIVPANLSVAWGYTFNAETQVASVLNVGTHAEPMAGIELRLHWSVDTALMHSESTGAYFVRGDGQFVAL